MKTTIDDEHLDNALYLLEAQLIHDSYETGLTEETIFATAFHQSLPDDEGYVTASFFTKDTQGITLETRLFTKVRYVHTKVCNKDYLTQEITPAPQTQYN